MAYKIKYSKTKCNQLAKVSCFQHYKSQDSKKKKFQGKHCEQIIHFVYRKTNGMWTTPKYFLVHHSKYLKAMQLLHKYLEDF